MPPQISPASSAAGDNGNVIATLPHNATPGWFGRLVLQCHEPTTIWLAFTSICISGVLGYLNHDRLAIGLACFAIAWPVILMPRRRADIDDVFVNRVNDVEEPAADIVFVHGLGGDWKETWTATNGAFWPEWVAREPLEKCRVWCLHYPAAATAWTGNAMPLPGRAKNVLQRLAQFGIGQRPIVFVAHSLGGLLIKAILRTSITHRHNDWTALAANTKGIMFLATPHVGTLLASVANIFRLFRVSAATRDLQRHESSLIELNDWFRANFSAMKLKAHVLSENEPTFGVLVVDAGTVDPGIAGVRVVPLDRNHITIAKAGRDNDSLVMETRLFIAKCLDVECETTSRA